MGSRAYTDGRPSFNKEIYGGLCASMMTYDSFKIIGHTGAVDIPTNPGMYSLCMFYNTPVLLKFLSHTRNYVLSYS